MTIDEAPDLELDYEIPEAWTDQVAEGARVAVPLRNRQTLGTVLAVFDVAERGRGLRPIVKITHDRPLLTPNLLRLSHWMADYYCSTREAALRAMLPTSVRVDDAPAREVKIVHLAKQPTDEDLARLSRRAPRRAEVLQQLLAANAPIPLAKLLHPSTAKPLAEDGWLRIEEERLARDPHGDEEFLTDQPLPLSEEQGLALEAVTAAIAEPASHPPLLLHGVTGSGKTEIYLQAADRALAQGKSVLVLVPEISLTPQTVERFKSRFADRQKFVAVLHSHLSTGERFDEWHKIHRGEARIVIGARSAIFAPLVSLGLIIVDEEHEHSYKQDSAPRYHCRDLAVMRAKIEGCAILLGSATPSLETHHNVLRGKYRRLNMASRVDDRSMPLIRVVDMRIESRKHPGGPAILSEPLRQAMEKRLAERQQIILFLNRRGYASAMQCLECGHVCGCPHCAVSLTYHLSESRLICHVCGYKQVAPNRCPKCKSPSVKLAGFGTERAEEVLRKVFPQMRMARVDADIMQRRHRLAETLRAFRAHKLDALVGTQMIAKGLHFPNVTLVGILNADVGLHMPDFRAGERTFQLITQVAGRAGRGELLGEVIVQTFSPQSPAIQFARHHDYEGYCAEEMELRRQFRLPPYTHATLIHVRSPMEHHAEFTLGNICQRLRPILPEDAIMGEPAPSPLSKAANLYRFQVMVRGRNPGPITQAIRQVLGKLSFSKDMAVSVDVDAFDLG